MKTTIYDLLGMIKDNNIPQRIIFKDQIYEYVESAEDYYNEEHGYIFDVYVLKSILNDEVEILETTITYKPDKIEKLEIITKKTECGHNHQYLVNGKIEYRLRKIDKIILDKINEIIDRLNNE